MKRDVVATWNENVIFAGRLRTPIRPCDLVADAPGEFEVREDGTLVSGDLRVRVFDESARGEFAPRRKWKTAIAVLGVSLAMHALALVVSRETPVDAAAELAARRALIAHLLSVHTETPPEDKTDEVESATGAKVKGEEGAMGAPRREGGFGSAVSSEPSARDLAAAATFGMIGITGGRGEGFGVGGAGWGDGHGRILDAAGRGDAIPVQQSGWGFRAGEWDDNASLREFRRVLRRASDPNVQSLDVSVRRVIVARDASGKALPSCPIFATDAQGKTVTLRTLSSGRALLFPRAEGLVGQTLDVAMRCGGNVAEQTVALDVDDAMVTLDGREPRDTPGATIDVGFALDTTGSMAEEIAAVKSTLASVAARASNVRVGLVEYKDRSDPYLTRVFQMTSDVSHFASVVAMLSADGGGDEPEAVNVGLHEALSSLAWNPSAPARLLFLIGDAPPHADDPGPRYADEAKNAAHMGVQIFTVAASGMNAFGQIVFRQLAQYTGGTEMFVLRGGAGPQSVGGGDPLSSCGGTQTAYRSGNLDALVIAKIDAARTALDASPIEVRGVGSDVVPTRCGQR
jgi:hypothetical protein